MEFEDSFEVSATPEVAWDALTDIERVYPCLPGAELEHVSGNEFRGFVTLKLGPITAAYHGTARFEDLDRENRTLVIHAEGRDKHGQGTAKARVTARLIVEGDVTRVEMSNQVDITGKAAQFGRGIIQDVSKEILGEFASNLQQVVAGDQIGYSPATPAEPEPAAAPAARARPNPATSSSIGVLSLGRRVAARRVEESPGVAFAGIALGAGLIALLIWWFN